MMSLYKTFARPHVEYCVSAWNPHYIKDKKLIEKVQRRYTNYGHFGPKTLRTLDTSALVWWV